MGGIPGITGPVPLYLLIPKTSVRRRAHIALAPLVPMPETSVHEYCRTVLMQNDIRSPGKISAIEPVTETSPIEFTTHRPFRPCVLGTYPGHAPASLKRGHSVCHKLFDRVSVGKITSSQGKTNENP